MKIYKTFFYKPFIQELWAEGETEAFYIIRGKRIKKLQEHTSYFDTPEAAKAYLAKELKLKVDKAKSMLKTRQEDLKEYLHFIEPRTASL